MAPGYKVVHWEEDPTPPPSENDNEQKPDETVQVNRRVWKTVEGKGPNFKEKTFMSSQRTNL